MHIEFQLGSNDIALTINGVGVNAEVCGSASMEKTSPSRRGGVQDHAFSRQQSLNSDRWQRITPDVSRPRSAGTQWADVEVVDELCNDSE